MEEDVMTNRIQLGGAGFGEASDETIEIRARDIARQNGRTQPTDADRQAAVEELQNPLGNHPAAEENLTDADRPGDGTPPADLGGPAPTFQMDDEESVPQTLVLEGIEEADRESRALSAELSPDNDEARLEDV